MKSALTFVIAMALASTAYADGRKPQNNGGGDANAVAVAGANSSSSSRSSSSSNAGAVAANYSHVQTAVQSNSVSANAPGFSSGHPCSLSASFGISILSAGAGASGGGSKVDNACLLAQMGKTSAAVAMIAARDRGACKALRASGDIAATSDCGDGGSRTSSRGAEEQPASVRCERNASGKVVRIVKLNASVSTAAARAACAG